VSVGVGEGVLVATEVGVGVSLGVGVGVSVGLEVGVGVSVGSGVRTGVTVAVASATTAGLGVAAPGSCTIVMHPDRNPINTSPRIRRYLVATFILYSLENKILVGQVADLFRDKLATCPTMPPIFSIVVVSPGTVRLLSK
jgi:hypothetical protein